MTPSVGLNPSVENTLRYDLTAGLVVFLVALPLCLGIALASGAPLFAGVIAGVVGGTVVAALSGSQISVAGPAAGLAVIVANAIQTSGTYQIFLCAVVAAGMFQILLGVLRMGGIGNYVPNSVIKGMLAAIGIVIILKQIPHALGRDSDFEGDFAFVRATGSNTLEELAEAVVSANPAALVISALSLAILLLWDRPEVRNVRLFKQIPGPLLVVLGGIGLNEAFRIFAPGFELSDPEHMVRLPVSSSFRQFLQFFTTPDFTGFARQQTYFTGATLAIVASLETLLSIEAADKLDPFKRITQTNRELFAQGIGNTLSGLIGGLPITSVVVRTSANVYAGARTKIAAITHGILLLLAAMFIPAFLNRTPLACLAAILLVIGYRLARVALFRDMWRQGVGQFLPFIVTVLAIVFTDLLIGVGVGFAVGLFFVIRANHRVAFTMVHQDRYYLIRFNKDATFVNKAELKERLRTVPENSTVIIDATKAVYIDKDIYEVVGEFRQLAYFRNIKVELKNFYRGRDVEEYVSAGAH
jgi:MFS superfamily sulfate permease-like transporter